MTVSNGESVEIWKPIEEYYGYEVSNFGNVRSLSRLTMGRWGKMKTSPGRLLKPDEHKFGYLRVELCKDGKKKKYLLHRLVAAAFIDNPEAKRTVNHIDSNRKNNHISNLEWCTHKENTAHGVSVGRIKFPNYDNRHLSVEQRRRLRQAFSKEAL